VIERTREPAKNSLQLTSCVNLGCHGERTPPDALPKGSKAANHWREFDAQRRLR